MRWGVLHGAGCAGLRRRSKLQTCAVGPKGENVDKMKVRELALQVLQKNPQTHVHMIENELRQLTSDYDRHDTLILQEVIWELLVQGVLAPGKNSLNLNLPFVHVTEYGARCLDDGAIRAHDPEGYAAQIAAIGSAGNGEVDRVLIESVREAQLCFLAGRFTAAIVMLARASEVLLNRLARALDVAVTAPNIDLAPLVEKLATCDLPPEIAEQYQPQLAGLRSLLDLSRSDDGGPLVASVERDQVLGRLLLFPAQCRFVYDLVAHLEGDSSG